LDKLVIDGAGDFFGVPCSTEACLDTLCCRHWKIYKQLKLSLLSYTVAAPYCLACLYLLAFTET
jgi:hypothetical protein